MCHSLANLEHHHFKFAAHRQPNRLHIHYMGADCLSFGEDIRLQSGDVMEVEFQNFGRTLCNVVTQEDPLKTPVRVRTME